MPGDAPFLAVDSLVKQFGGVLAVNNVTFSVRQGEILGLIGPNGAGKTTTFNLISGRFPLSSGEVRLEQTVISGLRPDRVAGLGIARTFQGTRIFPELTVLENVETAQFSCQRVRFWEDWLGLPSARRAQASGRKRAREVLEFIGLDAYAEWKAGSLAYALQSLLGIGMALALDPKLLLLDEPFAGMNPRETMQAAEMVKRIRAGGLTVLLVEHDMAAVMGICDRIVVLDQGRRIAEGTPAEVRADPVVIEAYLGTDEYA